MAGELPAYLDLTIGRQTEVSNVRTLLERADVRLVTLTGVGGVGKTRVAVRVARLFADDEKTSIAFVDFAPVDDSALFAATIAQALDINDPGDSPLLDRISAALRDRRALLLLDNF